MTSRSKGLDYYFNKKSGKQYWVHKDLPQGWSKIIEADRRTYYFHISDEMGTRSLVTDGTDQEQAAQFYSKLSRKKTSDRADSRLYHMRCMNNWVKSVLIQEYSQKQSRVLDLACGKGGDMNKWARHNFQMYMGVDIALGSLEDAATRIQQNADLSRSDIHLWHRAVPLDHPHSFDVVSMQFAFHYMFCDEARATQFFVTLHSTLRPGGMFIATTIDPNRVIQKLMATVGGEEIVDGKVVGPAPIQLRDGKDRALCTIRMDPSTTTRLLRPTKDDRGFGLRYMFTLIDGDDEEAVNLPEYLIPSSLLHQMLDEHGFDLVLQENFQTFIGLHKDSHKSLLMKMNVLNFQGTISDVEWDIAGLYQVLAFKKRAA
ncbi:hypothetical protein DYB32_006284 [Aphanomyces invadans]|uniref:mRNA cap guanine-N(7) methyltransferase n=1 Tax=Aphanomyces invadans TaxID=157072 RepID=A0A3R6Z266_9STRA|nr:hypothetical protein DYB32_006284 [Aphanomyces invadans]